MPKSSTDRRTPRARIVLNQALSGLLIGQGRADEAKTLSEGLALQIRAAMEEPIELVEAVA